MITTPTPTTPSPAAAAASLLAAAAAFGVPHHALGASEGFCQGRQTVYSATTNEWESCPGIHCCTSKSSKSSLCGTDSSCDQWPSYAHYADEAEDWSGSCKETHGMTFHPEWGSIDLIGSRDYIDYAATYPPYEFEGAATHGNAFTSTSAAAVPLESIAVNIECRTEDQISGKTVSCSRDENVFTMILYNVTGSWSEPEELAVATVTYDDVFASGFSSHETEWGEATSDQLNAVFQFGRRVTLQPDGQYAYTVEHTEGPGKFHQWFVRAAKARDDPAHGSYVIHKAISGDSLHRTSGTFGVTWETDYTVSFPFEITVDVSGKEGHPCYYEVAPLECSAACATCVDGSPEQCTSCYTADGPFLNEDRCSNLTTSTTTATTTSTRTATTATATTATATTATATTATVTTTTTTTTADCGCLCSARQARLVMDDHLALHWSGELQYGADPYAVVRLEAGGVEVGSLELADAGEGDRATYNEGYWVSRRSETGVAYAATIMQYSFGHAGYVPVSNVVEFTFDADGSLRLCDANRNVTVATTTTTSATSTTTSVTSTTVTETTHTVTTTTTGTTSTTATATSTTRTATTRTDTSTTVTGTTATDTSTTTHQPRKTCDELGWAPDSRWWLKVCGESDDGLECIRGAAHHDASAACLAAGARLCTVQEIHAGVGQGTGCGLDLEMVWTSTKCAVSPTAGAGSSSSSGLHAGRAGYTVARYARGGGGGGHLSSECKPATASHSARCCSDTALSTSIGFGGKSSFASGTTLRQQQQQQQQQQSSADGRMDQELQGAGSATVTATSADWLQQLGAPSALDSVQQSVRPAGSRLEPPASLSVATTAVQGGSTISGSPLRQSGTQRALHPQVGSVALGSRQSGTDFSGTTATGIAPGAGDLSDGAVAIDDIHTAVGGASNGAKLLDETNDVPSRSTSDAADSTGTGSDANTTAAAAAAAAVVIGLVAVVLAVTWRRRQRRRHSVTLALAARCPNLAAGIDVPGSPPSTESGALRTASPAFTGGAYDAECPPDGGFTLTDGGLHSRPSQRAIGDSKKFTAASLLAM